MDPCPIYLPSILTLLFWQKKRDFSSHLPAALPPAALVYVCFDGHHTTHDSKDGPGSSNHRGGSRDDGIFPVFPGRLNSGAYPGLGGREALSFCRRVYAGRTCHKIRKPTREKELAKNRAEPKERQKSLTMETHQSSHALKPALSLDYSVTRNSVHKFSLSVNIWWVSVAANSKHSG